VAELPLAKMVTVAGTLAEPELDDERAMDHPPAGAGPLRVTVPVVVAKPPSRSLSATVRPVSLGGLTVKEAVFTSAPRSAVTTG
jgi:hypothetical protein